MQPLSDDAAAIPERVLAAGAIAALLLIGLVGGVVSRSSDDKLGTTTTSENTEATTPPDTTTTIESPEPDRSTLMPQTTNAPPAETSEAPSTSENESNATTTASIHNPASEAGCLILKDNDASREWNDGCTGDLKDQCGNSCSILVVDVDEQTLESVVDALNAEGLECKPETIRQGSELLRCNPNE